MQQPDETSEEPASKKKRILTLSDKLNIINKLDEGVTPREIARQFSVTTSAISKIKKKKADYLSKTSNEVSMQQKNLRMTSLPALEDMTYAWLCQKICLGEPINGPILCEKALVLNEKMNGPSTFKASNGWLYRFKRRHGIKHLSSQGDNISNETTPSEQFVIDFKKYLENNGYDPANIYSADETGLNWKSLPDKLIASEMKQFNYNDKEKDHITAMFCSNAMGTHKIPILVIGNHEKLKSLNNSASLPVIYKAQKNSLMDRPLFIDWYTNVFIPAVRQEQENTGERGKVLLLLDNAPCHSSAIILNSMDDNFLVMYLPPNVTTALQPMNQGIIETAKNNYRKTLALRLLLSNKTRIDDYLDNMTIKDCCEIIADAWQSISPSLLSKAWEYLVPRQTIVKDEDENLVHSSNFVIAAELVSILNQIDDFNIEESDVLAWLNEDNTNHGWAPLTDEQLIAEAIGNETYNVAMDFINEPHCEVTEEGEHYISAQYALDALNIAYKWYEKQEECNLDDLMTLNKIRNTAMAKVIQEK